MHKIVSILVSIVIVFGFSGILSAEEINQGVLLEGEYVGPSEPVEAVRSQYGVPEGEASDAPKPRPYENLPTIEAGLFRKAATLDPSEEIRVIIYLAYQPNDVTTSQVEAKYAGETTTIKAEIQAIKSKYISMRNTEAATDAENYSEDVIGLSTADQVVLREIHERNEALSLKIKNEITSALKADIESYQQSVKDEIEWRGGTVEFGTIAGNAIVAVIPTGILEQIAALEKVARVVEDGKMQQDLNIADDAAKVSASGGLWNNSFTGGLYDPAVIDSGTDLLHPALENDTYRDNFYSWYLTAGFSDPCWDDVISVDDENGHGTHVMGIVGSYGSTGWTDYLGMSYGVEKAVTLKAGFNLIYNTSIGCYGGGSMYRSDAMQLLDRALYDDDALVPFDTFSDDVDGINLSYSGEITTDENDYSRFWDSLVSSYPDLVVTLSAGNSGPNNPYFRSPACAYNPITVANVNDQNTADRDDDTILSDSTRGPTENGRRKPDLAAPGSYILSCNNDWESELDFISKSGTSMAAPNVLGVAMDMMDAGVTDELEIKALLINTAQKNEPGINFESDADGWSEAYGWGYMNAWAAYYHRNDVLTASVTERPNTGYYRLYSGPMRDESSGGEGRDRVTMVWNRHATYNPHAFPTTYYGLSDLNLRLYRESDNYLVDYDTDADDNVHQVRINSGVSATDVVVKAYAWSSDFAHGGTTETFALATEEDFVEVELPATFQGMGSWRTEVEPNEEFDVEFWLRNDSDLASHTNEFKLLLPVGWTIVSGAETQSVGSIAGGGGLSSHVVWRVRAQPTPEDVVFITSQHSHNSYAESWGPYNWSLGTNVRWDTTPPIPNPMTWATEPYAISTSQIRMVATTASDLHQPVQYLFLCVTANGNSSSWQTSTTYTDSGLPPNTWCGYRVRARDNASTRNYTAYSAGSRYAYTMANLPGAAAFSNFTQTSIRANWTTNGNPPGTAYYCENMIAGTTSGWTTSTSWNNSGLTCGVSYSFRVKARNGDGVETGWRSLGSASTLPCADVCECDLNPDHSCNILDYQIFIQDWGRSNCGTPPGSGNPPNDCECDLNTDGDCNILDYQVFIQDWGRDDCP